MIAVLLLSLVHTTNIATAATEAPPDAEVRIIWPKDGDVISRGRLWVRMGLAGMGVCPAGVQLPDCGHHHLILNGDVPELGQPIPANRTYIHAGGGQIEHRLTDLPPGEHTLQLVLADHDHKPHDPPIVSEQITIAVPDYEPAETPEFTNPYIYIGWPEDGHVFRGRAAGFRVWFGLRNYGVAPKGTGVPNTGHFYLLIDRSVPQRGEAITGAMAFTNGETQANVDLAPGEHTLQIIMGDNNGVFSNPRLVSEPVTIRIE